MPESTPQVMLANANLETIRPVLPNRVYCMWFPLSASMLPQQVAIVVLLLCECYRKRAQINVPVDKQVVLFPDDA